MPHLITSECIQCGACESVCPTNAIYAKGEAWMLGDTTMFNDTDKDAVLYSGEEISVIRLQPPLEEQWYFIVPEKCTDCLDQVEIKCVNVCPKTSCIIKDTDLLPFKGMPTFKEGLPKTE